MLLQTQDISRCFVQKKSQCFFEFLFPELIVFSRQLIHESPEKTFIFLSYFTSFHVVDIRPVNRRSGLIRKIQSDKSR